MEADMGSGGTTYLDQVKRGCHQLEELTLPVYARLVADEDQRVIVSEV